MKPEMKILQLTERLTTGGPNFDEPGAEHLAQKVDGTDPEGNENAFFPNRRFDHVRIAGQETETKGNYYAAVVKNGKVILFPVRRMFQLRPQLNYMDKAAKKMAETRDIAESTDEEELAPVTPKGRIIRPQPGQKVVRAGEKNTFIARQRQIAEEEWKQLNIFNYERLTDSVDEMVSSVRQLEFATVEGYLDTLSHHAEKCHAKVTRPLRDKVLEFLWDGQAVSYGALLEHFPDCSEKELNSSLIDLCWAVGNYFTVKGAIRYGRNHRLANARDRVIYAMGKGTTESSSQTKKTSVANLARWNDGKWELVRPAGEDERDADLPPVPTGMSPGKVPEVLSKDLGQRLEEWIRNVKKQRSPSRSPARSKSPRRNGTHGTEQTVYEAVPKTELNAFKTEPCDEPSQPITAHHVVVKNELEHAEIFAGPSESEETLIRNKIVGTLSGRDGHAIRSQELQDMLGLRDPIRDFETKDGTHVIVIGEKVFHCENERERFVLSEFGRLSPLGAALKSKELWGEISGSEMPVSQKTFEQILRKFCYRVGQSWQLKPK